ncbi:hypothetical protein Golob_021385 [Gossypium lobatum]|uniref:Aminotransferase-like plant mobile domain-containing protein n=1 Tax=Gossypium lobatum TaxID=34289 RepID=A0A7J8LDC0_9ROSI|nr:hypothetical protein [Gossypium lobatum]
MERWRLETHIFHLSCGEWTITLDDATLQLDLSVDGPAVTGAMVKVSLIVFAIVEMHKPNRGKIDEDWAKFHEKYIYIWEHRYNFLPMCEPILAPELKTSPEYMTWFRYHSKSYLLSEEKKTKQFHQRRPRRPHMNPRSGVHALMESSSAPNPQVTPMATPPSSQYGVFVAPPPSPVPYGVPMPTTTPTYLPSLTIPTFYPDNKRWKPRMTQHSSTEERKEDEDEGRGTPTTKKPSLQLTPTRLCHTLAQRC